MTVPIFPFQYSRFTFTGFLSETYHFPACEMTPLSNRKLMFVFVFHRRSIFYFGYMIFRFPLLLLSGSGESELRFDLVTRTQGRCDSTSKKVMLLFFLADLADLADCGSCCLTSKDHEHC
jgi:hypothetical protein